MARVPRMLRSTISAFTRVCDAPQRVYARLRRAMAVRCGSGVHDGARSRLCVAPFHAATRPGHEGSGAVGARNFPIGVFIEWRRPYLAIETSSHAGADPAGLSGRADTRPRRTDNPEAVLFDMFAVACAGRSGRGCQRCRADGQCQKPDRRSCHAALQDCPGHANPCMIDLCREKIFLPRQ